MLVGLFVAGLVAGWLSGGSTTTDAVAPVQHSRHKKSKLDRELREAERRVNAAKAGAQQGVVEEGSDGETGVGGGAAPLAGLTVAVDPGHNGENATHPSEINRLVPASNDGSMKPCNTTGTETNDGRLTEAQFNFDVGRQLRSDLQRLGARVVMTRSSNRGVGPCVDERAEIANRAGAAVLISIHADGEQSSGAHGFHVIHAAPGKMVDPSLAPPSGFLATAVRNALVDAGVPPANYVGKDGLDTRSDLAGLNLARVPAILVELGNMRSAEEATELESAGYRARLAKALSSGLRQFLEEAQL